MIYAAAENCRYCGREILPGKGIWNKKRQKSYCSDKCCMLSASASYRKTEKGKAAKRRDENSAAGRARAMRYLKTESGWSKHRKRIEKYKLQKRSVYKKDRWQHQRFCIKTLNALLGYSAKEEYTAYSLRDSKTKAHCRCDAFYAEEVCRKLNIPFRGIVVEIDGAQHYMPIRFGGISLQRAIDNLRNYQRRDFAKQEFCLKNNYAYVVIPYTQKNEAQVAECFKSQLRQTKVLVSKQFEFAYAHKLCSSLLSDDENEWMFGKCNNKEGHGHNMKVTVEVRGFINPLTGMVINFHDLKRIVNEVLNIVDHKNINADFAFPQDMPTTCENMLPWLWDALKVELPILSKLTLCESDTSSATLEDELMTGGWNA